MKNRENHASKRDKIRKNFFWSGSSVFLILMRSIKICSMSSFIIHRFCKNCEK